MKNIFSTIKKNIALVTLIFVCSLFIAGSESLIAASTYTSPSCAPTDSGCNTDAPITTGTSAQTIGGNLSIEGTLSSAGAFTGFGNGLFNGSLNLGTTSIAIPAGSKLLVDGYVSAKKYCNVDGTVCSDATSISKVHYFTGNSFLSRFGGSVSTTNTSTQILSNSITFTESEIRTFYGIPTSVNIKGILVDYEMSFYHSTKANNGFYRMDVSNSDHPQYYAGQRSYVSNYDETATQRLGSQTDSNFPVIDFGDDGNFIIDFEFRRYTLANLPNNMYFAPTAVVTGYITD